MCTLTDKLDSGLNKDCHWLEGDISQPSNNTDGGEGSTNDINKI